MERMRIMDRCSPPRILTQGGVAGISSQAIIPRNNSSSTASINNHTRLSNRRITSNSNSKINSSRATSTPVPVTTHRGIRIRIIPKANSHNPTRRRPVSRSSTTNFPDCLNLTTIVSGSLPTRRRIASQYSHISNRSHIPKAIYPRSRRHPSTV